MRKILLTLIVAMAAWALLAAPPTGRIRPGDPEWPRAWVSYYGRAKLLEKDAPDLKAHGVGLVEMQADSAQEARQALEIARRVKLKYCISLRDVTWDAGMVRKSGLEPVYAVMIGGAYRGRAIDRHLFKFSARPQKIVIEPPVYHVRYAYTDPEGRQIAHYYPFIPPPVWAEVVVPLRAFDGKQHLKIIPAKVEEAPPDTKVEADSVTPEVPETPETRGRKLYFLSFDLSGLDKALLDKVGVAAYWEFHGAKGYYSLGNGTVSAAAESSRQTMRAEARDVLRMWSEANGGKFPLEVIPVLRCGDEIFYLTTHNLSQSRVVSYPLFDYSEPGIRSFHHLAGPLEYPRTWGFPEIYGTDAYAWWLYTLHKNAADLIHEVHQEIDKTAPGILVFRNTTRFGVFSKSDDFDGTGPELLVRQFDLVHLDPYPNAAQGMDDMIIPRDMSYFAGLARRYHRPLVPWMQAHHWKQCTLPPTPDQYPWLVDPTPEVIDRMAAQQWAQGIDAVLWLGYGPGSTFPSGRPDSWERAAAFHRRLTDSPPPKPQAKLAVLRPYRVWALESQTDGLIRNPADYLLQQFLDAWAVHYGQPYDVFELPPKMSSNDRAAMDRELAAYKYVVSTEPRPGAWVIGAGTIGQTVDPATAESIKLKFEAELKARGWMKGLQPQLPLGTVRPYFPNNW
jgi:hypothetical protein